MESIRDKLSFGDISWLMPKIDVQLVLERLNVRLLPNRMGNQIYGWCPDHYIHVKRNPSHPKWTINVETGQTMCFTEGRGSNLVWIVSRLRKCSPKEAVDWMLGDSKGISNMEIASLKKQFKKLRRKKAASKGKATNQAVESVKRWLRTETMVQSGYEYFMRPPGKKPTLIEKETVDRYRCVQLRSGYYANRVVIPFFSKKTLIGFEAVDVLGKKEWLRRHPTLEENQYKKVLYSKGFKRSEYLFGLDEIQSQEIVALTEGAREVMKLRQLGYPAVAILGASVSQKQIMLLAEANPKSLILLFDGDDAGYEIQRKVFKQMSEFFETHKGTVRRGYDPKTLPPEEVKKLFGKFGFFS